MERDNEYHNRHNSDRQRRQDNEKFENYRDRYTSRGNYYGMRDTDAEYRNMRSTGSTNYGSGPVGGYDASSYRGGGDRHNQNHYHYGDPNPYMGNDRNGGYERTRGTGWRDNNDRYSHYGSNRTDDRERYDRQDNSYQYGDQGQGRRYSDFGRDEGRTYNQHTNRGYNAATEDSYYDRSDFDHDRSDNDYRGSSRNPQRNLSQWQDRYNDSDDFRYSGRIQSSGSDRGDTYATGLYASNRAYNSDNPSDSDGDRSSSRQRRSGRSGPDYSSRSSISDYGAREYRG
ncbi:hypothetical protein [Pontibacter russatus]|uniref:hypothetical protein n=1 Tax=Pontibacter russatus TaxID=2694929 RepID=UPI001F22E683|nr:hypothetical protein [Pontibacter russatus]